MNRKHYALLTSVMFGIGGAGYGLMAVIGRELLEIPYGPAACFAIYGAMGGVMTAGMLSGILLFVRFIKNRKTYVKVICVVFFPLTIIGIVYVGVLTYIPYTIYNTVLLRKIEKNSR